MSEQGERYVVRAQWFGPGQSPCTDEHGNPRANRLFGAEPYWAAKVREAELRGQGWHVDVTPEGQWAGLSQPR